MAPGTSRARFNSSALVRLLASMAPNELPDHGQTLGEQLGLWLGWTDAIALANALGTQAEPSGQVRVPTPKALAQDQARTSAQLAQAFAQDPQLQPHTAQDTPDTVPDFAPYRRSHQAHQAAMDTAVPALRGRVRAALAARPGAGAQLAALDQVMEHALAERERQTLASVPRWLESRYRHLHTTHAQAEHRFRQDLQDVLRAELELRLLPVQGLIDALQEAQAGTPAPDTRP